MRRVVSLFLPAWATDRIRRESRSAPSREAPLVTVIQDGNRRVLAAVDEAARKEKLYAGMPAAQAQSLVLNLTMVDATPEADLAALNRLALWCMRYSPLVSANPPDGIFIDIAGAAHLFKGEAALIEDLIVRLRAAHIAARAAVADTPGCAWAVARHGRVAIVAPGRSSDALGALPVAALRLSPNVVESLADVGIERVAQLASKPRGALLTRFGGELLRRFDQALGLAAEPLIALQAEDAPFVSLPLVEPISTPESLQQVIDDLCARLMPQLESKGVGARRLDLVFLRVDNIAQAIRIGAAKPSRDKKHLAKLLKERLVLVDPGFGVERATLTASWVEPLEAKQLAGRHVADETADLDLGPLVDTLRVRLGGDRVYRLTPVESDIPERAMKRIAPVAAPTGATWPEDLPRPARLFSPPEPITAVAQLPDSPPRMFTWRKRQYRIFRADGPERILGEWWFSESDMRLQRDYYRVECADGKRFWLFRDAPPEEGGRWWLHGMGEA